MARRARRSSRRRSLGSVGAKRCKFGVSKTTGKCLKTPRKRSGSLGRVSSRRRSRR